MGGNVKHEPVLFLDATGSQKYSISSRDGTPRWTVLTAAVKTFVTKLAESDSAAFDKNEEGGGVLTYAFQGGYVRELGDLNPGNFANAIATIHPGGNTLIMPAIAQWQTDRDEEFSGDAQADMNREYDLLVATDGALDDEAQFISWAKSAPSNVKIFFLLVGQGDDNMNAIDDYTRLAKASPDRVVVYNMQGQSDPATLAQQMLAAIS